MYVLRWHRHGNRPRIRPEYPARRTRRTRSSARFSRGELHVQVTGPFRMSALGPTLEVRESVAHAASTAAPMAAAVAVVASTDIKTREAAADAARAALRARWNAFLARVDQNGALWFG